MKILCKQHTKLFSVKRASSAIVQTQKYSVLPLTVSFQHVISADNINVQQPSLPRKSESKPHDLTPKELQFWISWVRMYEVFISLIENQVSGFAWRTYPSCYETWYKVLQLSDQYTKDFLNKKIKGQRIGAMIKFLRFHLTSQRKTNQR